ncbi:MAG: hypothetical protein SW833_20925 [Cyanobacteriota bacterium]|nr:hypothetical protein [Cyanobacteriota bacterium]
MSFSLSLVEQLSSREGINDRTAPSVRDRLLGWGKLAPNRVLTLL